MGALAYSAYASPVGEVPPEGAERALSVTPMACQLSHRESHGVPREMIVYA